MRHTIEVTTAIQARPEEVFDLELDMNAHAASLAASGETATTSTGRPQLGLGDEVTITARHLGRRWRMTSRVTEFDRPCRFVDEQVQGPFAVMRHEHLFASDAAGGTVMTDRMTFAAPLGPLGWVVSRAVLARYLRRLLVTRAAHIAGLAEGRA